MKYGIKKLVMLLIIFVVTFGTIYMYTPISYAGILDNARNEGGTKPPPATPPDEPQGNIDPSKPSTTEEIVEYVTHYTGISGNAYEEIEAAFGGTNGKKGIDSSNYHLPIGGVIVEAGGVRTVTDANGNYKLNLPPGNYTLKFIYGMLDGNTYTDKKQILKYNGHDYITTTVAGGETYKYKTRTETEITTAGKGCEQIILAIDCSYSVRDSIINVNGKNVSKLKAIVDSTKELVNSLLSSGENIYIGLVFFSGTCYRAQGLTNNKEILLNHLDYICENNWYTANTDLVSALKKVDSSFINTSADSNRHIIVLSDGVPTADGIENDRIYRDDSDSTVYYKLNNIKTRTVEEINRLRGNGINIKSIYIEPEDEEELNYIKQIFDGNVDYFKAMQGNAFISEITGSLKEELIQTTNEKEYQEHITIDKGVEDEGRRTEVDNNYNRIFYYNNDGGAKAKLFGQINNITDSNLAKELSDSTYMTVTGGNYTIDASGGNRVETFLDHYEYEEDENGEEKKIPIYGKRIHVDAEYTNQDLGLTQRPALDLQLAMTITGAKTETSKGILLKEEKREMGSDIYIKQELDDELIYGANARVEYTIEISNRSSLQCNYLNIITYLPKGFGFDENDKLITENLTNANFNWKVYDTSKLMNDGYITADAYEAHKNQIAIITTMQNDGTSDSFYIAAGGSRTIKFVTSSVTDDLERLGNIDFEINAEILGYADNGINTHRRMATSEAFVLKGVRASYLKGLFPGNNQEHDYTSTTNYMSITPPLGSGEKMTTKYIICIICILPLIAFGEYTMIKKITYRKKR